MVLVPPDNGDMHLSGIRIHITRGIRSNRSLGSQEAGHMFVRRGPAIVLSLVLSAAALVITPGAMASDGGTAKDVDSCSGPSAYKLRVMLDENDRLDVVGVVWSNDDDLWSWRFRHNDDLSAKGEVRSNGDADRSFRIQRTMYDFPGTDNVVFRAENQRTGEVCRGELNY